MATRKTTRGNDQDVENAILGGAETIKDGFEQAVKNYDQMLAFGKDNAEAVLKSANAAGRGFEVINSEIFAYTRKSMEGGVAAIKAVLSARTFEEAFRLQGDYGKVLFQSHVDEAARLGELALSTARETAEPLQARVAAAAELIRE